MQRQINTRMRYDPEIKLSMSGAASLAVKMEKSIERKLFDLLKPKFKNPCYECITREIMKGRLLMAQAEEAVCNLFDRVRIRYRHFETRDKMKKWFVVDALFESLVFCKLNTCFSTATEAKVFFESLKKEFCKK